MIHSPLPSLNPGMPSSLLENADERLPSWYTKDPADVFVLVKAFVSDHALCQEPLLVLPGCKLQDITAGLARLAGPHAPCVLATSFLRKSYY